MVISMRIELIMSKDGCYNCFEAPVVSVMKWANRDYELMFLQSWGFRFDKPVGFSDICIGEYLYSDNSNMLEALKDYHGVEIEVSDVIDADDFLLSVRRELDCGRPVMFLADVFYCPWFKGSYQTKHSPHYVIIVDIDDESNLLCMDSQAAADEACYMSRNDLIHSYHQNYITFNFKAEDKAQIGLMELLTKSISKLKKCNVYGNSFDQMRVFGSYINENGINFIKETSIDLDVILEKALEKYSYGFSSQQMDIFFEYIKSTGLDLDPHEAYIFDTMKELSNGRNKFRNYLLYLAKRYEAKELYVFGERIKNAADRWNSMFGMLAKAYYLQDSSVIIKRVAAKINEAADDEEEIAQGIEDFIKNNLVSNIFISVNDIEDKSLDSPLNMKEFYRINLINYFNGKGFAELSNPSTAEISNGGRFLISDNLPHNQVWNVDYMEFEFPKIDVGRNDNISCIGQTIDTKISGYKYIMFLGCSEFGDHSEHVTIEHKNGVIEKIPLELSSWLKSEPNFNETVAWIGKCAVRAGDTIDIYNFPAHLYAKCHPLSSLEDIVRITLPICPNIHIFGISLSR